MSGSGYFGDGGRLDPTVWAHLRTQATAALRKAAGETLHAHGTQLVTVTFDPPRPGCGVVVGDAQALRSLLPGAGALSPATLRHVMRTMTRLGLATNFNPAGFAADFDGEMQRMMRAIDSVLDERHPRGRAR